MVLDGEDNGGLHPPPNNHNLNHDHGAANFIRPPQPLVVNSDNSANNWKLWVQQYEWFEIATNMSRKPQNVQIATFMSSIGTDAVVVFNTFGCSEEELASIDAIKQRFKTYFTPKANIRYERYQFNRMSQEEGKSFDEFLTKVKAQSAKCGFDALHDSLLKDKIIIGIRSDSVREKLLADEDSTLDQVTQKCRASELTSKQLRNLKDESSAVHAITKYRNTQRQTHGADSAPDTFNCKRCGRVHGPKSCPAYKKKCKKCDREGHFADMCRATSDRATKSAHKSAKKVHTVETDEESENEFFINSIEVATHQHQSRRRAQLVRGDHGRERTREDQAGQRSPV